MEAPLLFLQLKKASSKGFIDYLTINSTFLLPNGFCYQNNISFKKMFQLFEFRSEISRFFLKKMLFYKFLIFINFEFSNSYFFSEISLLLKKFFSVFFINTSCSFALYQNNRSFINSSNIHNIFYCIIQRYIGFISYSELSLFSPIYYDFKAKNNSKLNMFFDVSTLTLVKTNSITGNTENILFNTMAFDLSSAKYIFSLIFPIKHSYEQEVSFFDCFLRFKKTTAFLSPNTTRKSINSVFSVLSIFFKTTLKYSWLVCFFMHFFINLKKTTVNKIFYSIIGETNDGFSVKLDLQQGFYDFFKL